MKQVRKRKTNNIQYHLYVELKYDTNELIYKTETLTDIEKTFVVAKEDGELGRDDLGVWDQQMQAIIYRMDKQ